MCPIGGPGRSDLAGQCEPAAHPLYAEPSPDPVRPPGSARVGSTSHTTLRLSSTSRPSGREGPGKPDARGRPSPANRPLPRGQRRARASSPARGPAPALRQEACAEARYRTRPARLFSTGRPSGSEATASPSARSTAASADATSPLSATLRPTRCTSTPARPGSAAMKVRSGARSSPTARLFSTSNPSGREAAARRSARRSASGESTSPLRATPREKPLHTHLFEPGRCGQSRAHRLDVEEHPQIVLHRNGLRQGRHGRDGAPVRPPRPTRPRRSARRRGPPAAP